MTKLSTKQQPVFKNIGFERYQRLMGVAEEIGFQEPGGYTLLDVGSLDGMFRKFVPGAEYSSYQGFITRDKGTPYPDNAFDVVVAADVLEHVPELDREAFIRELARIARKKVVFSFPGEGSEAAEAFILTILPGHKWLKEHRENTLPRTQDVDNILNRLGLTYLVKPNHCLASWVLSVLFDNMNIDVAVRQHINSFMQEQFFNAENRDPAYRYIYTITSPGSGMSEKASGELLGENRATESIDVIYANIRKLSESSRHDEMLVALESFVQWNPDHLDALNDLAVLYFRHNQPENALDCLTRAIGKSPLYRPTVVNLTHVLKSLSQTDIARQLLENYINHNPDDREVAMLIIDLSR